MRHGAKVNHLGRKTPHRKALLRNLACQLIQHKRIVTTLAKAKALRVFVEPLITKSKTDTTHHRRIVFSYLHSKEAIKELFDTVNTKVGDRPGGYTRIIKMDRRIGDAADMAMIELVDFNEIYNVKTTVGEEKKKTRRGRVKKVDATPKAATPAPLEAVAPVAETAAAIEDTTPVVDEVVNTVSEPVADVIEEITDAPVDTPATDESADANTEEKA